MKVALTLTLSLLFTAGLALGTPVALQYEGQLYGPNDQSLPVGLAGTGAWADPGNSSPVTLHWIVTQNPDSTWHYEYTLATPLGGVSHAIIEVSEGLALEDLTNFSGSPELADYTATSNGNSNPNLPGTIHGLKFDGGGDTNFSISFDTWRPPVWGDFYAKDGVAGGQGWNAIWDAGIWRERRFRVAGQWQFREQDPPPGYGRVRARAFGPGDDLYRRPGRFAQAEAVIYFSIVALWLASQSGPTAGRRLTIGNAMNGAAAENRSRVFFCATHNSYYLFLIISMPCIYGRRALGTVIVPSAFW